MSLMQKYNYNYLIILVNSYLAFMMARVGFIPFLATKFNNDINFPSSFLPARKYMLIFA